MSKRIPAKFILIGVILIFNLKIAVAQSSRSNDFKAIVRADNTFVSYNDSLSKRQAIPPIVGYKIRAAYKKYDGDPFAAENRHPVIFKVGYSNFVDIYIIKVYSGSGIAYKFFAFDHRSKKVTANPVSIYGKFMENSEEGFEKEDRLLANPYIYFGDIAHSGIKDIIIKERIHNGTIYNGEVDHVFSLNPDMSFTTVLCVESKLVDYLNGCMINRAFKNDILTCTLACKQRKPKIVGEVHLSLMPQPKIIKKQVFDPDYSTVLITGGDVSEQRFLKEGSSYSY